VGIPSLGGGGARRELVPEKWTKDQLRAKKLADRALKKRVELCDVLNLPATKAWTRRELHDQLDSTLDSIEKKERRARELFPKVAESFGVTVGRIPATDLVGMVESILTPRRSTDE